MKKTLLMLLLSVLIVAGCSDAKKETVETAKKAMELPDKAGVVSDIVMLRNAVNLHYAQKGYFPESLEQLNLNLNNPTEDFIYDQSNGNVKHKDYSQL